VAPADAAPPTSGNARVDEAWPCDKIDDKTVYCLTSHVTFTAKGTLHYLPGMPDGLPAMGIGAPKLGYIPEASPFTCLATRGANGVKEDNTASGKICEVIFDHAVTQATTGTATFTIVADPGASGTYPFGLNANAGTTWDEPDFYLRVSPYTPLNR
jgi:hypothetical protein